MTAAKLDPALCRRLAHDLRTNKLGGELVQWIDRRYLPHDDDTADRVAREIRDDIDGGRCEPLDAFEGPASAIAAQLTAAADLAERALTEGDRFTLVLAASDKKLKEERPGLCALLDRMLAGQLDLAFDRAARAITGQSAAALTEQIKPATAADLRAAFLAGVEHGDGWSTQASREIAVGTDEDAADEYVSGCGAVQPATASIGPDDTAIIDRALQWYSRQTLELQEYYAVIRIRAALASPGGGS